MAPRAASKRAPAKKGEDDEPKNKPSGKRKPASPKQAPRKLTKRSAAKDESESASEPESSASSEPSPVTSAASAGAKSETESEQEVAPKPAPKRTRRAAGSLAPEPGKGSKAAGQRRKGGTAKADDVAGGQAADGGEASGPRYFLMKSEPEEFSLDNLAAKKEQTSHWEGVRNAQARNIMKSMKLGDQAFFYHSSCKVPAVVGVVKVVREAYPDHFAFDKSSKYYDPRSTPDAPKWWMVDVQLVRRMERPVTLAELRAEGAKGPPIKDMVLINKSRLSVQPVTREQWERILQMEAAGAEEED